MRDHIAEPPTEGTYYLECELVFRWRNAWCEPSPEAGDPGGYEAVDVRAVALRFGNYDLPITEEQASAIAAAAAGYPAAISDMEQWAIEGAFA